MTELNALAQDDTTQAGFPPAPSEPHQRADVGDAGEPEFKGEATYSPEDNKLRFYPAERLSKEDYSRIKEAGFAWAPKQELFVAGMWTPRRAALMVKWCGEIGDESMTMAERAEIRAERFEGYSVRRGHEAAAASAQVQAIAGNIPFGQPILVGHHSERRARKDAERIQDGMAKAVRLWDTKDYWVSRASAAKGHADYKADPAVRYRRIKSIEADLRKAQKAIAESKAFLSKWQAPDLTHEQAVAIADYDHFRVTEAGGTFAESGYSLLTREKNPRSVEEVRGFAERAHNRQIEWSSTWVAHYENRLAYERAMLDAGGGLAVDPEALAVGGRVRVRGEWLTITRVTKKAGKVVSVSTNARYVRVRSVEEIQAYEAPSAELAEAAQAAKKLPPMANYPHEGAAEMTKAQWERIDKDYKGSREAGEGATRARKYQPDIAATTGAGFGRHRLRVVCVSARGASLQTVFLTDSKVVQPPALADSMGARPALPAPERVMAPARSTVAPDSKPEGAEEVEGMRATLQATKAAGGVQTVTANQLLPTSAAIAAGMVDRLQLPNGARVLEPSAGTGAILRALPGVLPFGGQRQTWCDVTAVEINPALAESLRNEGLAHRVIAADFLSLTLDDFDGKRFDAILMNPPFSNADDIKHIQHALTLLAPGGALVSICADGPRQREALQLLAVTHGGSYEPLPAGSFAEMGTQVNTAIVEIRV